MLYIASDHAGFQLKEKIKDYLKAQGKELEDCGAYQFDPNDDYPDFISKAAAGVSQDPQNNKAIILGRSGEAEMMVANKFKGVRAALFYTPVKPQEAADITGRVSSDDYEIVRLTREHNNANVLSLGASFLTEDQAKKAIEIFLNFPFPGDERHVRRLKKLQELENKA